MFTFKLYKGEYVTIPPNKANDQNTALIMAGHFIKDYHKVEVILNDKVVIKTLENDSPIFSAPLN
jgi:hypothetical protein